MPHARIHLIPGLALETGKYTLDIPEDATFLGITYIKSNIEVHVLEPEIRNPKEWMSYRDKTTFRFYQENNAVPDHEGLVFCGIISQPYFGVAGHSGAIHHYVFSERLKSF